VGRLFGLVADDEKKTEEEVMGEWKAPLSLRIPQDLRREMEQFAAKEHRTLGDIGRLLIEWAFEQLKAAGSLDLLLKTNLKVIKKVPVAQPEKKP